MSLAIGDHLAPVAPPGNLRVSVTPVTFPTKYVQDESLTALDLGLSNVTYALAFLTGIGGGSVNLANVIYDIENEKLRLYDETPAQVAKEAEVKEPTATVIAWGF